MIDPSSAEAREAQAQRLDSLAALSTVLTAINSNTNREALQAGAAALRAPVRAWQPISTAPKDGTEVLVYEQGAILISSWQDGILGDGDPGSGWWDNGYMDPAPTHWQPLPEPPVASPQTEQAR